MTKRKTLSVVAALLAVQIVCAFSAIAQEVAKTRKFKTTYKITMYREPDFNSAKVSQIPENVVLESLEETKRYGGYLKANYKNKTGWVLKAELKRYMDTPAPELVSWSIGYKAIGSVYRYMLVIRNDGTLPYVGSLTIRLLDSSNKIVFEKTADFSDGIQPDTGGQFPVEVTLPAARFELEYKGGKIEGDAGKLIEGL